MEHSRPEHRNELFCLQFAISNVTNVGAALLGGLIAAVIGGAAGLGARAIPSAYRVLLVVMAVAAALATMTVLALRDDRPRRRRDWQTLEQRPADAWAGEPISARPDLPQWARRGARLGIPRPSDPATFWRLLIPGFLIALGAGQVIPFLNVFIEGKFGLDLAVAQRGLRDHQPRHRRSPSSSSRRSPDASGRSARWSWSRAASIPFLVVLGFSPVLWTVIMAMAVRNSLMNAGNPIANAFAMEQLRPARAGDLRGDGQPAVVARLGHRRALVQHPPEDARLRGRLHRQLPDDHRPLLARHLSLLALVPSGGGAPAPAGTRAAA